MYLWLFMEFKLKEIMQLMQEEEQEEEEGSGCTQLSRIVRIKSPSPQTASMVERFEI